MKKDVRFKVAGVTFDGRQGVLQRLYGRKVRARLVDEPENPYDANAVAIYAGLYKVGYIPRDGHAAMVALREFIKGIELDVKKYVSAKKELYYADAVLHLEDAE